MEYGLWNTGIESKLGVYRIDESVLLGKENVKILPRQQNYFQVLNEAFKNRMQNTGVYWVFYYRLSLIPLNHHFPHMFA
jgi:hypothetical protein